MSVSIIGLNCDQVTTRFDGNVNLPVVIIDPFYLKGTAASESEFLNIDPPIPANASEVLCYIGTIRSGDTEGHFGHGSVDGIQSSSPTGSDVGDESGQIFIWKESRIMFSPRAHVMFIKSGFDDAQKMSIIGAFVCRVGGD